MGHIPLTLDGQGAGDNRKSLLQSSFSLRTTAPKHNIWVTSLKHLIFWEPETIRKEFVGALTLLAFMTLSIAFGSPLSRDGEPETIKEFAAKQH